MPQERNEASKLFLCDVANHSTLKALMCKTVQHSGVLSLNRQLEALTLLKFCSRKHRIKLAENNSVGSLELML